MSVLLTKLPPTNLQRGEPQVRGQWKRPGRLFPNPFTYWSLPQLSSEGGCAELGGGVGAHYGPAIPLSNMIIQALHLPAAQLSTCASKTSLLLPQEETWLPRRKSLARPSIYPLGRKRHTRDLDASVRDVIYHKESWRGTGDPIYRQENNPREQKKMMESTLKSRLSLVFSFLFLPPTSFTLFLETHGLGLLTDAHFLNLYNHNERLASKKENQSDKILILK